MVGTPPEDMEVDPQALLPTSPPLTPSTYTDSDMMVVETPPSEEAHHLVNTGIPPQQEPPTPPHNNQSMATRTNKVYFDLQYKLKVPNNMALMLTQKLALFHDTLGKILKLLIQVDTSVAI